jgi:hypothetical protein
MSWAPLRIKILDLDHMHTLSILCNTNEIDDHLIVEQTSTILLPTNMNRKSLKSTKPTMIGSSSRKRRKIR